MPLHNYQHFKFRLIKWTDFDEFRRSFSESQFEISMFLAIGRTIINYSIIDYWNLFTWYMNSKEYDIYGLFDDSNLVGFASISKANLDFGCDIIYWIRKKYQGLGLGKIFLFYLLSISLGRKGFIIAQLQINKHNFKSIRIAENLGLTKVNSEDIQFLGFEPEIANHFYIYLALENIFQIDSEKMGLTPVEAIFIWQQLTSNQFSEITD